MALPPTSRLGFVDERGAPCVPSEWTPGLIEVRGALEGWEGIRLWRQTEQLPVYLKRLGGEVRILADWPRSDPGRYRLRLESAEGNEELTVTIRSKKISPEAHARLLEDLQSRLPVSVALGLQRAGAMAGVRLLPPGKSTLAQELFRLERAVSGVRGRPGLTATLPELSRDPHGILKSTELWVRGWQARRPHPARLAQTLSLKGNLGVDGGPERVLDTRVEHTFDVYENRLVKAYFQQVQLRLRRLLRASEAVQQHEISQRASLLLAGLLRARRRAGFLDEVSLPAHLTTRITMVLLKRPPYRAALDGFLEFRRSASVRLEDERLDAPLENLPSLYQTWGTLRVIVALLRAAEARGYRVDSHRLVGKDLAGFYVRVLPDGKPAVVLTHPAHATVVKLVPERTYSKAGSFLRSISFNQRPDVAVEVYPPEEPCRVYLFDPKYKLEGESLGDEDAFGRPKKVDIDKMHTYRDAIRDGENRRPVRYAATLYPGKETCHYEEGLEALSAYPGAETPIEQRIENLLREALGPITEVPHPNESRGGAPDGS